MNDPYRLVTVEPPAKPKLVICSGCKHLRNDADTFCELGSKYSIHPVSGDQLYYYKQSCEDRNKKLDCADYEFDHWIWARPVLGVSLFIAVLVLAFCIPFYFV